MICPQGASYRKSAVMESTLLLLWTVTSCLVDITIPYLFNFLNFKVPTVLLTGGRRRGAGIFLPEMPALTSVVASEIRRANYPLCF